MDKILEVTGSGSGTARYGVRRGEAAVGEGHEIRVKTSPKTSRQLSRNTELFDSETTSPKTKLLCPGF